MDDVAIQRAIHLMESEFQLVTLTSIAENLHLSPSYLSSLFKTLTGKSFIEHLTNIRIKKAKELLLRTELKAYEISDIIGYQSVRYFSQVFKKNVGMLPSEYRTSVYDAYHKIKKMLIEDDFSCNGVLKISDISIRIAVNPCVVHEALVILEQEHMVTINHEGAFVANITEKDIKDVFELRELIEAYAVRQVMRTLKHSDLLNLERIFMTMDTSVKENNSYRMIELDMDFHNYFYIRCNNDAVKKTWESIKGKIMRYNALTNKGYSNQELREYHRALLDVIRSGDVSAAESKFLEHMQGYRKFVGLSLILTNT